MRLQAYDYTIEHRKGTQMIVPDALSRAVEIVTLTDLTNTSDTDYVALKEAIELSSNNHFDLRVEGHLIMKHINKYADAIDDAWRLYVPADHRTSVLEQFHDDKLAAHGGVLKTVNRIRRHFYWPAMYKDVTNYVRECEVCNATKPTDKCTTAPMGK